MTTAGPLVLIVDDEPVVRRFLNATLRANNFRTQEAATARQAVVQHAGWHPDIVLLDLGLPDGDGLTVLATLREHSRTPIIVLSARGRERDKVTALDAGADDYLTKPFGAPELLARIRVALRHAATPVDGSAVRTIEVGEVRIDLAARLVTRGGVTVHLTPTEYRLLSVLALHHGRVVTHQHLLREVWGADAGGDAHYLRVYMGQLRRKLEADTTRPRHLHTEPGVGYRLRDGG
ncbi:MAG: response regulator [Gemmatimonadales bacterium]|nr:response regulator [Gemmatimonadales bacterium]MDZ4389113.1 response regulator [Gemmatimonadales bacterium]